jgi:hypothetical protein
LSILPLVGLVACTGAPHAGCGGVARPDGGDFSVAVYAVLHAKCQTCHTRPLLNGAKMTLLTYEQTQEPFGITDHRWWQRMAEVIEPDGVPHMPYADAPQLTDGELMTLRGWFAACALPEAEGQGCDGVPDGGVEPTRAQCP